MEGARTDSRVYQISTTLHYYVYYLRCLQKTKFDITLDYLDVDPRLTIT